MSVNKNGFVIDILSSSRYIIDRKKIRSRVKKVLKREGFKGDCKVLVKFVGDRMMKKLNRRFMKKDCTTDVLSFPLQEFGAEEKAHGFVSYPDGVLRLGDIVVSYPQARRQAAERQVMVDDEIGFLVEHGLMHLLGNHHDG